MAEPTSTAPPRRLQAGRRLSIWWRRAKANPMALPALIIAITVMVIDQATKLWIMHSSGLVGPRCTPRTEQFCGGHMDISGFFDLTMIWNKGISFGLLSEGISTRFAAWIVLIAAAGGLVWLLRYFSRQRSALIVGAVAGLIILADIALVVMNGVQAGLFPGLTSRITLSLISISVAIGLITSLSGVRRTVLGIGIGFIIGGALGNVFDRVIYGAVIDFLDFSEMALFGLSFPWIFNIADAAINIGVACLLYDTFILAPRRERASGQQDDRQNGKQSATAKSDKAAANQVKAGQEDS